MSATRPAAAKSPAISAATATKRVAKAVLIGAVPPLMLKTAANPGGLPMEVFDGIRASVVADRARSSGRISGCRSTATTGLVRNDLGGRDGNYSGSRA